MAGRVADVFNDVAERNERMAQELARLSRVVGKEGKPAKRGSLGEVTGFWRDSTPTPAGRVAKERTVAYRGNGGSNLRHQGKPDAQAQSEPGYQFD